MGTLTSFLYVGLFIYLGGWYFDRWKGDFSIVLFLLTVVTLVYWLAERFWFAKRRVQAVSELDKQDAARRTALAGQGIGRVDGDLSVARQALLAQPWWLEWTAGLFPVILVVFLMRSFLFEPFKIPSSSMKPTLFVGDLILVNKFYYGVRVPIINQKVIPVHDPQRGDVMVFRYPVDPTMNYIKRVVGVPGDEVSYRNQQLYLNGELVPTEPIEDFFDDAWVDSPEQKMYVKQFTEKLGQVSHRMLVDRDRNLVVSPHEAFPFKDQCSYSAQAITCKVPPGHYFMMGDNRDGSADSRFWGFVPDQNIVGKAFFIWMNFSNIKRVGPFN